MIAELLNKSIKKGLQVVEITCQPLLLKWRRHPDLNRRIAVLQTAALPLGYAALKKWSGKRDLNPRLRPWQGRTLPLSYSRPMMGYVFNDKLKICQQKT